MEKDRCDCLSEILESVGLKSTDEQTLQVAKDFSLHLEMEHEISANQFIGGKPKPCEKCRQKDEEIKDLKFQIECYKNNVKKRIPQATHVYLENGNVKFDID